MSRSRRDEGFADDLLEVAELLRDERPTLDPVALDAVKLRAMSRARRAATSRRNGLWMRSRLAMVLTIAFLGLGTGGAVAWVGGGDLGLGFGFGGHGSGSASFNQYRDCDHGQGIGKDHECHGHEGEHGKAGEEHGKAGDEHGRGH